MMTSLNVIDVVTDEFTVSYGELALESVKLIVSGGNSSRGNEPLDTAARRHRTDPPSHPPFRLPDGWTTVVINGWVLPIIAFFTLLTNCLVCVVLLRRDMRTSTNVLLVAMAVSDTLTAILPTPCFIRFYALGAYVEWVPYSWCFVYMLLTDYLPTITHTASVWLTLALAAQRYICVCRVGAPRGGRTTRPVGSLSVGGRCWSVVSSTAFVVALVFVASLAAHGFRFAEYEYRPANLSSRLPARPPAARTAATPSAVAFANATAFTTTQRFIGSPPSRQRVIGCFYDYAPFVARHTDVIFSTYYWARVIIINLVPCVALVVLNAALVWTMRIAERRRKQLMRPCRVGTTTMTTATAAADDDSANVVLAGRAAEKRRRRECRRLSDSNATTMMLVAVVGLMLAVELPQSVLIVVTVVENSLDVLIITEETTNMAFLIVNFVIVLSYPLNFFVYCAMSRKFRQTFLGLFGLRCGTTDDCRTGLGATSRHESTEADMRGGGATRLPSSRVPRKSVRVRESPRLPQSPPIVLDVKTIMAEAPVADKREINVVAEIT